MQEGNVQDILVARHGCQLCQCTDIHRSAVDHQTLVHHRMPGRLRAKFIGIVLIPGKALEDAIHHQRERLARHAHNIPPEGVGF